MSGSISTSDLRFLDGLRGLAALTIAAYHAFLFSGETEDMRIAFPTLTQIVSRGTYAVPLFIVLSGFVLMPAIGRDGLHLRGGWRAYLIRRSRRILPPYYVSLIIFVVLIAALPILRSHRDTAWQFNIPVSAGGLFSHLVMMHNLKPSWIYEIDGPMWSVATEYQIYFLLPLLLLPLWRRFGPWVTVVVALGLGEAVAFLVPAFIHAHPWFLGLFAMGMVASWLVQTGKVGPVLTAGAVILIVAAAAALSIDRVASRENVAEPIVGAGAALAIAALAARPDSRVRRVLSSRPLVWLGLFSYSIYLTHSPLLALANLATLNFDWSAGERLMVMWLIALPLTVGCGWIFYWVVERHFQTSHQKHRRLARAD